MKGELLMRRQMHTSNKIMWMEYAVKSGYSVEWLWNYCDRLTGPELTTKQGRVYMWALWLSTAATTAGITISLYAAMKALRKAGQSGKYENEREAVDDQEVWYDAYRYQSEDGTE